MTKNNKIFIDGGPLYVVVETKKSKYRELNDVFKENHGHIEGYLRLSYTYDKEVVVERHTGVFRFKDIIVKTGVTLDTVKEMLNATESEYFAEDDDFAFIPLDENIHFSEQAIEFYIEKWKKLELSESSRDVFQVSVKLMSDDLCETILNCIESRWEFVVSDEEVEKTKKELIRQVKSKESIDLAMTRLSKTMKQLGKLGAK